MHRVTDHDTMRQRACDLRSNQTVTERALWTRLRMRQVCGVRFLRQHVIGNFIVDFHAPSLRLVIELDGGQHYELDEMRYDAKRSEWLRSRGITVLRYTNLDVSRRLDDVLADIERHVLRLQALHPSAPAADDIPPRLRRDPLRSEGGGKPAGLSRPSRSK